ncbi:hypothetical protein COV24_03410 [candidate division WWE3 bacterium CG10_big_fil_rev_8_21_14_0_10_32_10]|uniref:Uncharacterized protein n=1 Tax=candidate division WWE3 bacterium CG10_big_fil_rev_8_21_14_0_10_32_10 TaxID=1975090 RepID=A0A2H0R9X9_UNCKA|nr:MAG: hypothetical protein COV24_03410 [candidate division WWE3 bacterium CG10_big_fil_rev_8_21_14_0_10_32_10]
MINYDRLLSLNKNNCKEVDKELSYILENICFTILDPISRFIYTLGSKEKKLKYDSFSEKIFNSINSSITDVHKSKTIEEFNDNIYKPILFAQSLLERSKLINEYIDCAENTSEDVLQEFSKYCVIIYNRFFIRVGKPQKRKRRKNGQKRN